MTDKAINDPGRRAFLYALAASPAAALIGAKPARAGQSLPHMDQSDPQAHSFAYFNDAAKVPAGTVPYKPGQRCDNCQLLQGNAADAWRPCPLFPGKLVSTKAWCRYWVAKP